MWAGISCDFANGNNSRTRLVSVSWPEVHCERPFEIVKDLPESRPFGAVCSPSPLPVEIDITRNPEAGGDEETVPAVLRDLLGPQLEPGTRLGRYTILGAIGSGGMGAVYRAHDSELDRKVALKILHASTGDSSVDRMTQERLKREARAMAKLRHAHVITVHDVGTIELSEARGEDGQGGDEPPLVKRDIDFMAMELVEGSNLAEWLDAEPRPWRAVVEVFLAAGRGLAAAHRVGLVHRDFKPANVLIGDDGRVLVTDFGLARGLGDIVADTDGPDASPSGQGDPALSATVHAGAVGLTRTGMVIGTPAYMAPEQHFGTDIDARADQFGFCVSLYQGLYGVRPFAGDSIEELRKAVSADEPPVFPSGRRVPRAVRQVIARGLRVERDERYDAMDDLLAALESAVKSRRKWIAAAAVAGAAVVILAVGGAIGGAIERKSQVVLDECSAAADRFSELWNDRVAVAVEDVFSDSGSLCADSAIERISPGLDSYRDAWLEVHSEVCSSRGNEDSEAEFHARMGCLLDQRDYFASTVLLLTEADADMVDKAVEAVEALPEPGLCRGAVPVGLSDPDGPAGPNPGLRQDVALLRTELARADALRGAADWATASAWSRR